MQFVKTEDGMIPISKIDRIFHNAKGETFVVCGARVRRTHYEDCDDIEDKTAPVIPASPGWHLLIAWGVDFHDPLETDPLGYVSVDAIIAWRVFGSDLLPLILDSDTDLRVQKWWGIRTPDGKVIKPNDCRFHTEDDWRDYVLTEKLRVQKEKKAEHEASEKPSPRRRV